MPASTMQLDLEALTGLTGVRAGAWQRWKKTGWPDHHSEQWRFTRLSGVEKMDLRPAHNAAAVPGVRPFRQSCPIMLLSCILIMVLWMSRAFLICQQG